MDLEDPRPRRQRVAHVPRHPGLRVERRRRQAARRGLRERHRPRVQVGGHPRPVRVGERAEHPHPHAPQVGHPLLVAPLVPDRPADPDQRPGRVKVLPHPPQHPRRQEMRMHVRQPWHPKLPAEPRYLGVLLRRPHLIHPPIQPHYTPSTAANRSRTVAAVSSAGRSPDVGVEDLDLDVAVVARRRHARRDRPEVDHPVAEMPAAEQHVLRQRQHPVADLVADDPPGRPGDLAVQPRIPPHVVGVHHHPHRVGRERQGQIHRLAKGGDHAPVGAEHRVQRLDPQPHPQPLRLRHQLADRIGDHLPGQPEVPAPSHQPSAYQDQRVGLKLGRLGDRGQVVCPCRPTPFRVAVGEEPAPAQTRHVQPGRPNRRHRLAYPYFRDPIPPQPDPRNLVPRAQVHRVLQPDVLNRCLVKRQPLQPDHPSSPPPATRSMALRYVLWFPTCPLLSHWALAFGAWRSFVSLGHHGNRN